MPFALTKRARGSLVRIRMPAAPRCCPRIRVPLFSFFCLSIFSFPCAADFEAAVTTALGTLGEKCSVQSRRYDDLDPFLFLPDEGFRQDYAAKQFDKVDMIFIGTHPARTVIMKCSYRSILDFDSHD